MKDPRRTLWLLVGIVLLAFALRLYQLDRQSIWYDEGLSIYYARHDLPQLLEGTSASDHPPLYFVLLHAWLRMVGATEFATRYFSAIWGLLLIPVVYRLGQQLLGRQVSLLAVLLLALSPFHVWYAQEVRMYTLVVFFNTAASLALLSALRHGDRRSWLAYVLLTIAGLYAHFYTIFVLVFQGAFALWLARRSRWWRPLILTTLAQMTAGAAFLPWGPFVMEQIQTNDTYWRGTLALGRAVSWLLRAFAVGESVVGGWAVLIAVVYALLALTGGLIAARTASSLGQQSRDEATATANDAPSSVAFVSLYVVVPIFCLLILSYNRPKFAPRYLLSVTPAYYLLVGCGLVTLLGVRPFTGFERAPRSLGSVQMLRVSESLRVWVSLACFILIPAASALSLWTYYTDPDYGKPDFRGAARYITAHAEDDDGVVIVAGHSLPAFVYYNERDLAVYPVPARLLPTVTQPVDRRLVAETLNQALTDGHSRLWLVLWQEELADPMHLVLHNLERYGRRLGVPETFHDVALMLFEVPPGARFPLEPEIPHPLAVSFDGQLELVGYELDRAQVRPGDTIRLTLYWRAQRPLTENYTAFTHLLGPAERMLGQEDRQLGGDYYPSSHWPVGEVFEEIYPITVHADAPPGRYPLWVGLYLRRTMERLAFVGAHDRPETRFLIAEVEVER